MYTPDAVQQAKSVVKLDEKIQILTTALEEASDVWDVRHLSDIFGGNGWRRQALNHLTEQAIIEIGELIVYKVKARLNEYKRELQELTDPHVVK